jgi:hypothetical protein
MAKKTENIILRVDRETKAWIEAAANDRGQNITTFLLEAAAKAAGREIPMSVASLKPKGKGPCPTWFLARCYEARHGGTDGYFWAGYQLAKALPGVWPHELEEDQWYAEVEKLIELLPPPSRRMDVPQLPRDPDAAWHWFEEHLPRCAALVPARRRDRFLLGASKAAVDGEIEF